MWLIPPDPNRSTILCVNVRLKSYRDSGDYYDCSSLAFYAWKASGKNISHVAIYIGDGKVVEAKGTNYGVIYGNELNQGKIVTICRP